MIKGLAHLTFEDVSAYLSLITRKTTSLDLLILFLDMRSSSFSFLTVRLVSIVKSSTYRL